MIQIPAFSNSCFVFNHIGYIKMLYVQLRWRLYTVLTNKSVCMLQGRGLACMEHLYMKVNMQVADLFCAPKEHTCDPNSMTNFEP